MTIRVVGSGTLTAEGIASKASRLDDALVAGLAVPTSSVVPDGLKATQAAKALLQRHRGPVAVRSAFAAEDRPDQSLAGHFDSLLNVPATAEAFTDAIGRVRSSGTEDYRRDVLVMDMVTARQAGVAFSERGWLDDLVNYTHGLADDLLSGEEAGASLALDRRRREEDTHPWQGRLAALLAAVRDHFGDAAWDIEFADDGTNCWLLQIRPITSSPVRDEWFTLANHREILPDPPSVLMTSLIELASPELTGPLGILDGGPDGRRFIEVFDRRPYLNLSLLTDFLRKLGLPTALVADSLGGSDGSAVPIDPVQLVRQVPTLGRLGIRQLTAAKTARRVAARLARVRSSPGGDFGPIIDDAAASYVALVDQMASLATAMAVPVSLLGRLGVLDHHLRKQRTAATVMLDDLHALAASVIDKPDAIAALERGAVPEGTSSGVNFHEGWDRWLDRHGQRGQFESDLSRPRYNEDPAPVLITVARLATAATGPVSARSSLIAVISTPLWWFAKGPMAAREALRADAMRAFAQHRADLLRCAAVAVAQGALPSVDDVWMLTVHELRRIDEGQRFDADMLAERRADFERCAAIDAPDIRRRFGDVTQEDDSDGVLRGLTLTRGRVTGTAWVLNEPATARPTELDDLADGEVVLIARSVDAGWVPLFGQIGAVAVDIGGDLSHGSIILRELGLPAITNTRRGTKLIQTGDRVRLDAGSGTLERLEDH